MGRGRYPRSNRIQTIVQTVQRNAGLMDIGGSGAAAVARAKQKCWTFGLENPTPISATIAVGTEVSGIPSNGRIMVSSVAGILGYAPQIKSKAILAATGSASLSGVVLEDRRIHLCIS